MKIALLSYEYPIEIYSLQDADLEYHRRDYLVLLQPLLEGEADAVFGNRFHGGIHRVLYFWHFMGNRALTLITNIFTGLNLADMEVGYKVFTAEVLGQLSLKSNRFGFEPEITVKARRSPAGWYRGPCAYRSLQVLRLVSPADEISLQRAPSPSLFLRSSRPE